MSKVVIFSPEKGFLGMLFYFVPILMILGFPRFYNTEVPMAILLLPFYYREILDFVKSARGYAFNFAVILSFWFSLGILSFLLGIGNKNDVLFHSQLLVKIVMNVLFGIILYSVLKKSRSALLFWIVFQLVLIGLSAISRPIYLQLLEFASPSSAEIFKHIYGLRTVGFGLVHVDGSLTLITASYLLLLTNRQKFLDILMWFLIMPVSMTLARSGIIAYSLYSVFSAKREVRKIFLSGIAAMFIFAFIVTSGPLFEAVELFRNLILHGGIDSTSAGATAEMFIFPDSFFTWFLGDGRYFGDLARGLSFYMNTDIGYLRLIFFGGLGYLLSFLAINLFFTLPVLLLKSPEYGKQIKVFAIILSLIFLILNAKGIQTISVFSTLLFCMANDIKKAQS